MGSSGSQGNHLSQPKPEAERRQILEGQVSLRRSSSSGSLRMASSPPWQKRETSTWQSCQPQLEGAICKPQQPLVSMLPLPEGSSTAWISSSQPGGEGHRIPWENFLKNAWAPSLSWEISISGFGPRGQCRKLPFNKAQPLPPPDPHPTLTQYN